ncbi:hypothetical protein AB0E63_42720 [Kribbella sp. NPDC026596]|uniref:hypothetical protein n=1 Tax=Kribbella sp. NPDC026596 TaxID=3155122 RepID=UPI0033D86ED1
MFANLTTGEALRSLRPRRGHPGAAAPVHILANRELTASMRQLRQAAGYDLAETVEILNETIEELYAEVRQAPEPDAKRRLSAGPQRLTVAIVRRIERGEYSAFDHRPSVKWVDVDQLLPRKRMNASRVPAWLVRAYDVAFGADGFLTDMFTWSTTLQGDQLRDRPRRVRDLPTHVPAGGEYQFLIRDLGEPDAEFLPLLQAQAAQLAALAERQRTHPSAEAPSASDASGARGEGEERFPEGSITAPGVMFASRFVLHNLGEVPWRDRLLYRIGSSSIGLGSTPLVPLPDTDPGGSAAVEWVLRSPMTPGTYRACLKMALPDGAYCFPTTLVGLLVTIVVPPADLADPYEPWPDHA